MLTLFIALTIFLLIPYVGFGFYLWRLFNTNYYKIARDPKDMDKGA